MNRMPLLLALVGLAGGVDRPGTRLQARPALDALLPDTTCTYVATADLPKTVDSFYKTQFGRLLNDKQLRPFLDDFRTQLDKQGGLNFLGFPLEDVIDLAAGEAGYGAVKLPSGQPGHVLFVDVNGKGDALKKHLASQARRWKGSKERQEKVGDASVTIWERDSQVLAHLVKDNLLIAADNLDLLRDVLGRWGDNRAGGLSGHAVYRETMQRCQAKDGENPQVRFFLDPFARARLTRPAGAGPKKKDSVDQLISQGFNAIKGIGGFVIFDTPSHDMFYRAAMYAPPPYTKGMRMLQFPDGEPLAPEEWVPANPVSQYLTFRWDLLNAFDSFETVFDMLAADGDQGTFKEVLDSLKNDVDGPHVDLRKQVISQLRDRVTIFSDNAEPINTKSARTLVALATKNEDVVKDAVERFLTNDPRVVRRLFQKQPLWEVPPKKPKLKPGEKEIPLPTMAVAVTQGHLFIATHVDLLEMILRKQDERAHLADQADFREVQKELQRLGGARVVGRMFSRPSEDFRVAYELLRTNKLEGAESLYSQLLLAFLNGTNGKPGLELKGDLLPEFKKISHHFTAAGGLMRNCPGGWEYMGFALKKDKPTP
jgi:hypothetical protein